MWIDHISGTIISSADRFPGLPFAEEIAVKISQSLPHLFRDGILAS